MFAAVTLSLASTAAQAQALRVVDVSAPAINCLFDPACRQAVSDTTASIPIPAGGTNFVQSRTFRSRPGSPANGLYVYQYRIDLRRAVGIAHVPCLISLSLDFGPPVDTLDLDGNGKRGDEVFVVSQGGLGSVGVASAEQAGDTITFRFSAPVCAGGRPGDGQSTFFFGLVSAQAPGQTTATVLEETGTTYEAQARAPRRNVARQQDGGSRAQLDRTLALQSNRRAAGADHAVVDRLAPACVDRGGQVTVHGSRFGQQQGARVIELGGHGIGVLLRVTSWSDTRIAALVPDDPRIEYGQWYYVGLQDRDRRWISNISRTVSICRPPE